MCGTPNYISPEVASRSSHGLEVDVWGLGCMLYTLLVGKPPFDTSEVKSTLTRVVMAKYELPHFLSAEAKDLIDSLLKKNPKERIRLEQILDHPFLKLYSVTNNVPVHSRLSQDSGVHTMSSKKDSIRASVTSECGIRRTNDVCPRRVNSDCSPIRYQNFNSAPKCDSNVYQNEYHRSRSQERYNYSPNLQKYAPGQDLLIKCNSVNNLNEQMCNLNLAQHDQKIQPNYNEYSSHNHETSIHRPDQISLFSQTNSIYDNRHDKEPNGYCQTNQKNKCQHSCCSQNCHYPLQNIDTNKSDNVLDNLKPPINNFPINQITPDLAQPRSSGTHPVSEQKILPVEAMKKPGITVPQLCSVRLLPTRHRAKNAILSILDNGEVCVEIIKKRNYNREELVKEVCLISSDGLRIVIFEPGNGKGTKPLDKPPPIPQQGADAIYNYENLPEKHWKKYMYAARFVDLVRAKTPKVTYYSPKTKFQLMENLVDYEACFYEGKIIFNLCSIPPVFCIEIQVFPPLHFHHFLNKKKKKN